MNKDTLKEWYDQLSEMNSSLETITTIQDVLRTHSSFIARVLDDPEYISTRYQVHHILSYLSFHLMSTFWEEKVRTLQTQETWIPEDVFQKQEELTRHTFAGGWADEQETEAAHSTLKDLEEKYPSHVFFPEIYALQSVEYVKSLKISDEGMLLFLSSPNPEEYAYQKIKHFLDTSDSLLIRCPERSEISSEKITTLFTQCFGKEMKDVFY